MVIVNSPSEFTPLLGRTWLSEIFLYWRSNFEINSVSSSEGTEEIFQKFSKAFDGDYSGVIARNEASIVMMENVIPVFCGAYTVPYGQRERVQKEIERLVNNNILSPIKYSRWASPIVIVEKKGCGIRLCIDCKASINNNVKGLYRYKRLSFGVKTAPFIFQKLMDDILRGLKFVSPYMDDILIGGKTMEDCKINLYKVLERLVNFNEKVNKSKCVFLKPEIEYLGYKLSGKGISPTENKMEVITKAPEPKDIHEVKSYLGLLNFYGSFIPNLSSEMRPLYNLTRKDAPFI